MTTTDAEEAALEGGVGLREDDVQAVACDVGGVTHVKRPAVVAVHFVVFQQTLEQVTRNNCNMYFRR